MESKNKLELSRENSWGDVNLQTTHKPGLTDIRPLSVPSNVRPYHAPREPINMTLQSYSTEYFEPSSLPALKAKLAAAKQQAKELRYIHDQQERQNYRTSLLTLPHTRHTIKLSSGPFHVRNSSEIVCDNCANSHFDLERKGCTLNMSQAEECPRANPLQDSIYSRTGNNDIKRVKGKRIKSRILDLNNLLYLLVKIDSAFLEYHIKDNLRTLEKVIEDMSRKMDSVQSEEVSNWHKCKIAPSTYDANDQSSSLSNPAYIKCKKGELNVDDSDCLISSNVEPCITCIELHSTQPVIRFSIALESLSKPKLENNLNIANISENIEVGLKKLINFYAGGDNRGIDEVTSAHKALNLWDFRLCQGLHFKAFVNPRLLIPLYTTLTHLVQYLLNDFPLNLVKKSFKRMNNFEEITRTLCRMLNTIASPTWKHNMLQGNDLLQTYKSACEGLNMITAQSCQQYHHSCLPCRHSNHVDDVNGLALLKDVEKLIFICEQTLWSSWKHKTICKRHYEKCYFATFDKRPFFYSPKAYSITNYTHTYYDCLTRWRDTLDAVSLLECFCELPGVMWRRDFKCRRKQSENQITDTWLSGGSFGSRTSVLVFRSSALAQSSELDILSKPGYKLHISFRVVQAETKLLAKLLECHGIMEASADSNDYNILWTGSHPKPGILRSMAPYQRVNHFPRSYELTRKDRLYKNIEKMQHAKGLKHFDFIPQTFLMPTEYRELCTTHHRVKGPWIVKPAASSRGRGIYIVESPNQVPIEEPVVVAKYISKPLLIKGHKCDLRLYVAVTSFDPLLIYIYEEGMVRFATVKYDTTHKQLWNPCMHLCNYSINKYHSDYVKSDDPSAENVGHKWTLSALLRHLKSTGKDTAALMSQVEDVVIKAILSCANSIVTACKMFVPNTVNCFELYGFDILIDENLKPWLLEVNLSPSLGCDSPLDVRLKSAMLSDLLTLVGIPAVDPMIKPSSPSTTNSSKSLKTKLSSCRRIHSADGLSNHTLPKKASKGSVTVSNSSLTSEDNKMVKNAKGQFLRRGGFVRIFPAVDSWMKYAQYLDAITGIPIAGSTTSIPFSFMGQHNNNQILYKTLYPDMAVTLTATSGKADKALRMYQDRKRDGSLDNVKRYEVPVSTPRQDRYERKLSQGHKSTLSLQKKPLQEDYSADLKRQVCDMVKNGKKLSQVEARKAFSQYLMCVLKRISSTPDQDGHIEIVLKFLQKASTYLKNPFYVKIPSHKLSDKDRAAIVAKQLNDFLYLYNRETDLYADLDRPSQVPRNVFNEFLENSSECDLEEFLILQNIHTVPNSKGSDSHAVASFQSLLRCLPSINSVPFSSPEAAKKPVKVTPLS